MSLYNEVRPTSFDEMVEDYEYLPKFIKRKGHNHSFLFWGPSGTGKTSVGRLMAKELGATALDILEYNFQDTNGIDTVRDIIAGLYNSPMGKCRVYIIDEFQGATPAAQKALLKSIEEPPKHVYFFLCAMDTSKIEPAILNRCTKVEFKSLSYKDLIQVIVNAVDKKGWTGKFDDYAIEQVAKKAEGSARDALNLLEVLVDIPRDDQAEFIDNYRNIASSGNTNLDKLAEVLYSDSTKIWREVAAELQGLYKEKVEPESARRYMLSYGTRLGVMGGKRRHMQVASVFTETTFYNDFNGFCALCYKAWEVLNG